MFIRKYESSDQENLLALLRLNTPHYFSRQEENDLIHYLENYADNHYLILIDGVVLGCGGFNLSEDGEIAKLSWDIIHPDYHGKSLGTKLTTFRINKISQIEGIKMLSVRTSQLTFKFYEKFGLVLRETIKDYWDVGFDMYRLDCRIEDIQLI